MEKKLEFGLYSNTSIDTNMLESNSKIFLLKAVFDVTRMSLALLFFFEVFF